MSDGRSFHLPDLPNVGYATTREKALSDNIMQFMRTVERDRVRLLTIVLEGIDRWRHVAGSLWRGYRIGEDSGVLDEIYHYFELQAAPPHLQRVLLRHQKNAAKWREIVKGMMPDLEIERGSLKLMAKWQP